MASVLRAILLEPLGLPAVLVTGPMMVAEQIEALSRRAHGLDVQVVPFRPDMPAVLAGARAVVAMAGYNTVAEVLASGAPALLVPRTFPREEQRNRARRLAEQGSIRMLEPAQLDPSRLRREIGQLLRQAPATPKQPTGARDAIDILEQVRGLRLKLCPRT